MLHRSVALGEQGLIHGVGLIATAPIACGDVVWSLDPDADRVPCAEVASWSRDRQEEFRFLAFQCDEGTYAVCAGMDRYVNHSCDPNTWWDDDTTLVACRDILPVEEITCDYATFEVAVPLRLECHCGSPYCRDIVTNLDYQGEAWQRRYGAHLPSHVLRAIARVRVTAEGLCAAAQP